MSDHDTNNRRRFLETWLAGGALACAPAALAAAPSPTKPQGTFNVRDFGATGAGHVLDTKALQAAIDAAGAAGGTVYFPAGTYLSGMLYLKSHVTLHLEGGAVLLGSTNSADYVRLEKAVSTSVDDYANGSLLFGKNLENVTLTGRGTINGQGAAFKGRADENRPVLLRLVECRNVQVSGLTLRDSAFWMQHYFACEDVQLRGLRIQNRASHNGDGTDLDCCQRVMVSHCAFVTEDDAICLKSNIDRPCRDITISNCIVSSLCNAIKTGTASVGGFQNIAITNCTIYDTTLSGIALELVDGGLLENVIISNIVMRNVRSAIFLRLGHRGKGATQPEPGFFRNVTIENVKAQGVDKIGCAISGVPERAIEHVTLANIRLRFEGGANFTDAQRTVPERPESYPEYNMFGILPAYGFYCRHAKNVRFLNTQVTVNRQDLRPALVCDDVEDVRVEDLKTSTSSPVLLLRNTRHAWIESNRAPKDSAVYLRLEGKQTEDVCLVSNDLRAAKKPVELAPEVATDAVVTTPAPQPFEA